MFEGYYHKRRVAVTGHTGFKGAWISLWLHHLGASVWGYSLPAPTEPNFHQTLPESVFAGQTCDDIRDLRRLSEFLRAAQPEILFHMAAQPLVRRSYDEPVETFSVNALGTATVLDAVKLSRRPITVIVITSDKCYENREWEYAYRENDRLGGHDVYSMSKAAAELVVQSWNRSFFLPDPQLGHLVSVRAGNVIGGGDYAPDRLVPDCVRSLIQGRPIPIRHPEAVRPWQHVLECLSGYLWLGARLATEKKGSLLASPFNFGPDHSSQKTVKELVEEVLRHWPGSWEDVSNHGKPHEAKMLSLAIDKAARLLSWKPTWSFKEAITNTVSWYRERHQTQNPNMAAFSLNQIETFTNSAIQKGAAWAVK